MTEYDTMEELVIQNTKKCQQIAKLEQDQKVLIDFILRHHPEMDRWIEKNFGRVKE